MKTCPHCMQPVPQDATVCPHPGCGKIIAAPPQAVKRMPPPPPMRIITPIQSPVVPADAAANSQDANNNTHRDSFSENPLSPASLPKGEGSEQWIPPSPAAPKLSPPPPPGKIIRPVPPPLSSSANPASNAAPAIPARTPPIAPPTPPQKVSMEADSEQQRYLKSLQSQVSSGRRRSRRLAFGIAVALLASVSAWYAYFSSTVLSYARLDPSIRIERNGNDANRVILAYQPLSSGKIGFRHAEADRETELIDQVSAAQTEKTQRFEWRWRGMKTGDRVKITYRQGWSLASTELTVPEASAVLPQGDATLVGEVADATNNRPIAGAKIKLIGARLTAQTDDNGRFKLAGVSAGAAGVEISADKYSTEQVDTTLVPKKETSIRSVLSPGVKQGQIRMVLTWDKEPKDLDAHLEGPLSNTERFNISFQKKGDLKSREFVSLDVDAKNGVGPETITVLGVLPGAYHYFVHDYSNRNAPNTAALSHSGAEVKVYQGGQAHRFRADGQSRGTVWNVCDIVVDSTGEATVKKIDRYESRIISAEADLVFLLDVAPGTEEYVAARINDCLTEARKNVSALDCRFALVPFGESERKTRLAKIPPTGSIEEFERRLKSEAIPQGLPIDCVAAMNDALKFEFRPGASVQFILLTSSKFDAKDRIAAIAEKLKQGNISVTVHATAEERAIYAPLFENGAFTPFDAHSRKSEYASDKNSNAFLTNDQSEYDVKGGRIGENMKVTGIYSTRTNRTLEQVVKLGGSVESEDAVAKGLHWLARHQADDGYWADPDKCEDESPCPVDIQQFCYGAKNAETGLAILAFQAGGHYYFNKNKYSENVKRGLDWLVEQQKDRKKRKIDKNQRQPQFPQLPIGVPNGGLAARLGFEPCDEEGCLFGPKGSWYEHGIATFALAEACAVAKANGEKPDPKYLHAAEKAVKFMERHQYEKGGWQYALDSKLCGDTSVTGWQVLALKSAIEAKIPVEQATLRRVAEFYERCGDPRTGLTGYQSRGEAPTPLLTSVGLIVQEFILEKPDSELARNAVKYLSKQADQGIGKSSDFYTLYNGTLAMFLAGGESWDNWNDKVRNDVISRQNTRGCARGSWGGSRKDKNAAYRSYGRTLDTAWAVLALEVYYRYAKDKSPDEKNDALEDDIGKANGLPNQDDSKDAE